MPVEKVCVVCGAAFKVPPTRAETAKACSSACAVKVRGATRALRYANVECRACGTEFRVPFAHIGRRVYCSRGCQHSDPVRKAVLSGSVSGGKNPSWRGGKSIRVDGYIYAAAPGHPYSHNGYVFEHRLVMEREIVLAAPSHEFIELVDGVRVIRRDLHVHHIDGDRANNRPDNLLIVTVAAHHAIHSGQKPRPGSYWPKPANEVFYTGAVEAQHTAD